MNKAEIIERLHNIFLKESDTPAIDLAKKIKDKNATINKDGIEDITKSVTSSEESIVSDKENDEIPQNKFNYTTDEEKEYHDEMEIMNGQEMIQYDREPSELFKKRALEAIEGSSKMGNNPEWANVVAKGQGGDPEFGKKLASKIKSSINKRSNQTPTTKMFGDDWEVVKDEGHKSYAFESIKNNGILSDENYTHFAINKPTGKILNGWDYSDIEPNKLKSFRNDYFFNDLTDMFDDMDKKDIIIVSRTGLEKKGLNPNNKMDWYSVSKTEDSSNEINENINKISKKMKRLKFKKEFNGVTNAIKLIPESYKTDDKVFEMTDGNESYRIRWEGSLNEGKAVILMASNNTLINEDLQKMKHLMGYKSSDGLGNIKGKDRIEENNNFYTFINKSKKLFEDCDIDDVEPEKEAPFEEADIKQAPEAKKDIEGTVPTDKKSGNPKPAEGEWEKPKKQAPEAKKHIKK